MNSCTDNIAFPHGYKAGCNDRISKYGGICPKAADRIAVIEIGNWPKMIGEINLRQRAPKPPLDQGSVGSCAWESTAGGIMTIRRVLNLPDVRLNPYFGYHTTSHGRDNGSSIDENLEFARKYGIASQAVWPRSRGWRTEPSNEAKADALKYRIAEFYDIASWEEFGSALLLGFPVVFGYSGHSVLATSLVDTGRFEYLNSWGQWGDEGYGVLQASKIYWPYGAFAIRTVTYDMSV